MSLWILTPVFLMWREITMFRHAELCFVSRGIELTVPGLSRLRFFTRTENKQIRKVSENSRPYKLRKFFRCNSETEEYEWERKRKRRSVGGVWTNVSFWTRAPGFRIYKSYTEFNMDKRDTEECESSGERLCYCNQGRRAVASIPRDPDIRAKSSTQLV